MNRELILLSRHRIDAERWDKTIAASPDGRLYATSWFLDFMAPGWQALVCGDYEFVMPLPVRNKYGLNYVYQPAFCQQLGIFGLTKIEKPTTDLLLRASQKHVKYIELNGHSGQLNSSYKFIERKNFLLDLNQSFEDLKKQFSRSATRNINKAKEELITVSKADDASELVFLHRQRYGYSLATATDLSNVQKLFEKAIEKGCGHFFYAKDIGGNTIASSGYIQYKDRLTFLMNGNLKAGLDNGATHLLKSHVIETFAGQNLWMDFEGSDTASFARFYEQYGAKAIDNYPFFVFNNLPWWIKWLKSAWPLMEHG
ncbi:hypothetical protein BH10BAC3_BH10BAC3_25990 [soil metagenome]